MHLLIVTLDVEDYARFKAVFDAHPPERGGATFHRVCRDVDRHNSVTIISGFASVDQAIAWRDDPELRSAIGDSGVVGDPRVSVVEQVEIAGSP